MFSPSVDDHVSECSDLEFSPFQLSIAESIVFSSLSSIGSTFLLSSVGTFATNSSDSGESSIGVQSAILLKICIFVKWELETKEHQMIHLVEGR